MIGCGENEAQGNFEPEEYGLSRAKEGAFGTRDSGLGGEWGFYHACINVDERSFGGVW